KQRGALHPHRQPQPGRDCLSIQCNRRSCTRFRRLRCQQHPSRHAGMQGNQRRRHGPRQSQPLPRSPDRKRKTGRCSRYRRPRWHRLGTRQRHPGAGAPIHRRSSVHSRNTRPDADRATLPAADRPHRL
ncbi:uncharacterized protein RMCFA_6607, partial [Mycolicibacterium fortuitum subsp. acetamidolyticum]